MPEILVAVVALFFALFIIIAIAKAIVGLVG